MSKHDFADFYFIFDHIIPEFEPVLRCSEVSNVPFASLSCKGVAFQVDNAFCSYDGEPAESCMFQVELIKQFFIIVIIKQVM